MLHKWFGDMMKQDLRGDEAKLGERLRIQLHDRAKEGQEQLDILRERYRTLREAVGEPKQRSKRGLMDVGGSTLQWLFGVATDRDLETLSKQLQTLGRETTGIVHAMGQQATLVNETWRELGEHAIIMRQLEKNHGALEKEVNRWKLNILEKVEVLERQSTVALRIEDAFRSAHQTMDWVASKLEDLSVGLALLMVGNLPPELFPPTQLRAVLKEIRMSLQAGWDLTPSLQKGDLWRIYQEARVVSAATQSGVRLFIHLPIIEVTKSFELFKIFVLPVYSAAGNFGLHYAPLPEFLAVGEDRQIFMELTEAEVRSCQGRAHLLCLALIRQAHVSCRRRSFQRSVLWKSQQDVQFKPMSGFFKQVVESLLSLREMTAL
jgi:hypothetical protein